MGMKEVVDGIRDRRERAIQLMRRGEFAYAEREMRPLYPYMGADFRRQVIDHFNACNYVRVADLLEHLWTVVEVEDKP